MNADGSDLQRLLNSPAKDLWPSWSPDGAQIAFQSDRDGDWEIYVMDADGSNQQQLTDNKVKDSEPAWRP
jgi:Tol biopolymer transport system component